MRRSPLWLHARRHQRQIREPCPTSPPLESASRPLRRRNTRSILALSSQQISVIFVAVLSNRRDKRRVVSWWHLQSRVFSTAESFCQASPPGSSLKIEVTNRLWRFMLLLLACC